jgi:two-component system LytT family response regulator
MKITSLLIDDEILARKRLHNLLNEVPEITILGECSSGKEAIQMITQLQPQLIFLDIQMKDMTGFDVLNALKIKAKPLVIFVTAYDKYAIKGFDYFAFDYLLKPFRDERFFKSLRKACDHLKNNKTTELETKLDGLLNYMQNPDTQTQDTGIQKLPIKLGNKVHFINTKYIKYIEASGYYAEIHTDEKQYLLREPLSNLIVKLNKIEFARIHRSTIINLEYLQELVHSNYNELDVKMKDGKLFRISKSYKKELFTKLGL